MRIEKDYNDEIKIVKSETEKNIRSLLVGKEATKSTTIGRISFKKGTVIDAGLIAKMSIKDLAKTPAISMVSSGDRLRRFNWPFFMSVL